MSELYVWMAQLARNGALPPKKTEMALEGVNADRKANFTNLPDSDWAGDVGYKTRCVFSKYVELKTRPASYDRCLRKVTLCGFEQGFVYNFFVVLL